MKYISLCLMGMLAACSTEQVALLSAQDVSYPEQKAEQVQILSYGNVPNNCEQISVIITDPQEDVVHILNELRTNAAKVGGNLVNINAMGYTASTDKENKYATGTVYLCR